MVTLSRKNLKVWIFCSKCLLYTSNVMKDLAHAKTFELSRHFSGNSKFMIMFFGIKVLFVIRISTFLRHILRQTYCLILARKYYTLSYIKNNIIQETALSEASFSALIAKSDAPMMWGGDTPHKMYKFIKSFSCTPLKNTPGFETKFSLCSVTDGHHFLSN